MCVYVVTLGVGGIQFGCISHCPVWVLAALLANSVGKSVKLEDE